MRCKGVIMYKGIEKRAGGTFVNNGQNINYDEAYVIKFDEIIEGKINEHKLKFPVSNKTLYDKFASLNPYTQVEITCDVILLSGMSRLVPIDVNELEDSDEDDEDSDEDD